RRGACRGRRAAVHDLLRRRELRRWLRARGKGVYRRGAGRHRLAPGRRARRIVDRPHRDAVVGLLFHRLQGCCHLPDPRRRAGIPSLWPARQARGREGVEAMAVLASSPPTARKTLAAAVKDALLAALLALGLAVPILALRTEQNMSNELVL